LLQNKAKEGSFNSMSVIRVTTNFNIDIEFEAASFPRRLGAWLLDMIVIFLYLFIVTLIMRDAYRTLGTDAAEALFILLFIPVFIYHLICEILMNGQSIGKRILRIRVVNERGGQPAIGQYVIRWLIRTSDLMVLVIMLSSLDAARQSNLDYFWRIGIPMGMLLADLILVNSRRQQRLGDLLAHTLLISTRDRQSITDTVFLEVEESYVPSFPQVMQLSDRDINALKGILDTVNKRNDHSLAEMAAAKIKAHLQIDTTLPAPAFLAVLLKDYNYLSVNA
jgi:uncharacterized RDD family membrane protein YckC